MATATENSTVSLVNISTEKWPPRNRTYFGSLIVGYQSPQGLVFAGRVGTGFSEKVLADLYAGMQKLKRTTCPFVNLPEKKRGRWAQSLTPAIMKRCSWVEPVLVAQVKSAPKEMNASEYFSIEEGSANMFIRTYDSAGHSEASGRTDCL